MNIKHLLLYYISIKFRFDTFDKNLQNYVKYKKTSII
jgi:hypothetical protein